MRTGFADTVCCISFSENDAAYDVLSYAKFLWTATLLNVSTFFVHELTFLLLFSSAHFIAYEPQPGYSIISLGFVCVLIFGYAVCIFVPLMQNT